MPYKSYKTPKKFASKNKKSKSNPSGNYGAYESLFLTYSELPHSRSFEVELIGPKVEDLYPIDILYYST